MLNFEGNESCHAYKIQPKRSNLCFILKICLIWGLMCFVIPIRFSLKGLILNYGTDENGHVCKLQPKRSDPCFSLKSCLIWELMKLVMPISFSLKAMIRASYIKRSILGLMSLVVIWISLNDLILASALRYVSF